MMPVYFSSRGCIDDVVNNWTNYQFTSVIVIPFMNDAGVYWIIRTVFNVYICLNSWRYKHNQTERRDENQDIKGSFFKI